MDVVLKGDEITVQEQKGKTARLVPANPEEISNDNLKNETKQVDKCRLTTNSRIKSNPVCFELA